MVHIQFVPDSLARLSQVIAFRNLRRSGDADEAAAAEDDGFLQSARCCIKDELNRNIEK
jgi:hypothetical protein